MSHRIELSFWAVVILAGCGEPNAVLDVRMRLPVMDDRSIARVQVGTAVDAFEDAWGTEPRSFDLSEFDDGCNVTFSVEAPTPRTDREAIRQLRLKIWFCDELDPDCPEDSSATWRITLDQPLYPGERTAWRLAAADATLACTPWTPGSTLEPAPPPDLSLQVDKCQVFGCVEGDAAAGRDFCVDDERAVHPCED